MKKRFLCFLLIACLIVGMLPLTASATESALINSQDIEIGDYITLGTYYGEPIVWRCVDIDENGPLMLSDKIIAIKAFDASGSYTGENGDNSHSRGNSYTHKRTNRGSNFWVDSNIRAWLNSTASAGNVTFPCGNLPKKDYLHGNVNAYAEESGFLSSDNFTAEELSCIKSVTQKAAVNEVDAQFATSGSEAFQYVTSVQSCAANYDTAYTIETTDRIFFLNCEQLEKVYGNLGDYYLACPTQAAVENSEYKSDSLAADKIWFYWLRDANGDSRSPTHVRHVSTDGNVYFSWAYDDIHIGIRPAFYLNSDVVVYKYDNCVDCYTSFTEGIPVLAPQEADTFIKFICNSISSSSEISGLSTDELYKLMTGDFTSFDGNVLQLKANLIAMTTVIRAQNASKIQKVSAAGKNAAQATMNLVLTFAPSGGKISDADLGILSEYEGKVKKNLQDGLEDFGCGLLAKHLGIYLDENTLFDVNASISSYNAALQGIETAQNILNGVMVAAYGLKYACSEQLVHACDYFNWYLNMRSSYQKDDPAFTDIMGTIYETYKLSEMTFWEPFTRWCGVPDWGDAKTHIENWAEYICELEEYIAMSQTSTSDVRHNWEIEIEKEPADCTHDGIHDVFCSICGATKETVISATGHNCYTQIINPTCTESGSISYICTICGKTVNTETIPALNHNYISFITFPTCTEQGYTTYKCSRCSNEYKSNYTDALGHNWQDWRVEIPATCVSNGTEVRYCTRDTNHSETRVTAALGHNLLKTPELSPSCTENGYLTYWTCINCNSLFSDANGENEIKAPISIPSSGHQWDNGVITLAATHTTEGIMTYTCMQCSETKTEIIPKLKSSNTSNNTPVSYNISIPTYIIGGSISISSKSVFYGDTVTLIVEPDIGYELDNLVVTDISGTAIAPTNRGNGIYTFTMPDSEVVVAASFTALEVPSPVIPFTDVTASDWFYDAVAYAYDNSLMTGTSATTFSPNATTTRGMIVTILHRLEGSPAAEASGFADVESGAWYQAAVDWAAANGIVSGTSQTTFAPTDPITREQMAAILYRYAAYKGYDVSQLADLSRFSDSSAVNTYAADALAWANAAGLITGVTNTTLSPQGSAVRAQAATILMRFCENIAQ